MGCEKPELGGVELERDRSRLKGPGRSIHVEPRVIEVALMLCRHANEVVSRDLLIESIWRNYPGADSSLTNTVSKLRHHLARVGGDPSVIQTIPKRGYRAKIPKPRAVPAREAEGPGLAVLPFRNLGGDAEDDHLCEGLAEDVLNTLGHFPELRLAARASTFALVDRKLPLPELGEYLGIDYALDGSLRRTDHGLRIAVTLAATADQMQVWSSEFECRESELESLKTRITRALLTEAFGRTGVDQTTSVASRAAAVNPEAYNAFLKGRFLWYRENTNPGKALEQFHHAIDVAPDFALPYAGLVDCYCTYGLWQMLPQHQAREKALDYAEQAMALAPELPDVQFSHGYGQFYVRWRWSSAARIFQRVLEQSPKHIAASSFLAHLYTVLGRDEEAARLGERLVEIDPASWWCWYFRGLCSYWMRDFQLAARCASESLELNPGIQPGLYIASSSLAHLGRFEEALERARELEDTGGHIDSFLAVAACVYALCDAHGDSDRALAELRRRDRERGVSPAVFSLLHAVRGHEDEAIGNLQAMYEQTNIAMFLVAREPFFDPIRSRPEFREILNAVGLLPPARPLKAVR